MAKAIFIHNKIQPRTKTDFHVIQKLYSPEIRQFLFSNVYFRKKSEFHNVKLP